MQIQTAPTAAGFKAQALNSAQQHWRALNPVSSTLKSLSEIQPRCMQRIGNINKRELDCPFSTKCFLQLKKKKKVVKNK